MTSFPTMNGLLTWVRSRPIVWDTLTTTILSTIGKGVGFLIPFFVAAWFGISTDTDAFFFAYGLVFFFVMIVSIVLENIIVPFIAQIRKNNEKEVGFFVGTILVLSVFSLLFLSAIFTLFLKPLLGLITDFSAESLNLVFLLLIEIEPLLILVAMTSILNGVLNAYKLFWLPAISPALRAVIALGVIFSFKDYIGVHSIALGYVIGEVFRLILLFFFIWHRKILFIRFSVKITAEISDFIRTASPQLIAMIAVSFTPIINKTMASWLGPGNVSVLEYADRLYMIPITFLSTGFLVTILSHWSNDFYSGGKERFNGNIKKVLISTVLISLVITLMLILLKSPVVHAVYGYGKYPPDMLPTTETLFFYFLLGFTPYMVARIYVRAFIILKRTRLILCILSLRTLFTILFNLLFMNRFGIIGIAISATVVSLLEMAAMMYSFRVVVKQH